MTLRIIDSVAERPCVRACATLSPRREQGLTFPVGVSWRITMSEQVERAESGNREGTTTKASDAARKAFEQASGMAREAGARAKQAASDTASTVTSQVKELLNQQIGSGAAMAGQFASSIRGAANELDRDSPLLAGFVRTFANRVGQHAGEMQAQTVEQLTRT